MRGMTWGMLALVAGMAGLAPGARADTESCADFRKEILNMESTSVRPPGWVMLASTLRAMYARHCVVEPSRQPQTEYWFTENGAPLGVRADYAPPDWDPKKNGSAWRPEGGAFTTTPEIAAYCVQQRAPFNPGMCAMIKGLEADCLRPADSQARGAQCKELLAGRVPELPPPSEPMPPIFTLVNPAPPGAPQMTDAAVHADPGFQKMCAQAKANMNSCAQRRQNMTSFGASGLGSTGQAGAFYECQKLYGDVYGMCEATKQAALKAPASAKGATPPAAPPPAAQPKGGYPPQGSSMPPAGASPSGPQMSAQCQALVESLVDSAEAGQGAKSQAAYSAMKKAGCNALDRFDRAPPPASGGDPRFVARDATPLSDSVIGACDAAPDECEARVRQLKAGTSPEAVSALWANAIGIGLEMGNALAGGMLAGMPNYGVAGGGGGNVRMPGGGSNMNSIGNRPVRSTYGQGAPAYQPAPAQRPSDITGTSR